MREENPGGPVHLADDDDDDEDDQKTNLSIMSSMSLVTVHFFLAPKTPDGKEA